MKTIIQKLLPYLLFLGLFAGFVYSCNRAYLEARAKKRIENAMTASKTPAKIFTANDGRQASKTDVQELTKTEVKHIYPKVIQAADNVDIKPRHIIDYSSAGLKFSQDITLPVYTWKNASINLNDTIKKTDSIHYTDPWTNIKGTIKGDTLKLNIFSVDTITSFTHKGDRLHPWLWILSRRKVQQTIINSNPHTKILFQQAINTL